MSLAYEQAQAAAWNGEVPVGAIMLNTDGKVVAQAGNEKELSYDPTAHAEILTIKKAGIANSGWRLSGHSLFVTLEPCPMCLSALLQSRIDHLYFGAYDPKGGAISLGYQFYKDKRFNHKFSVMGGIMHYQCSQLLSKFFRERRSQHQK